ncbi:potassium transporter Kup [Brevibacterium sp. 5221]|uniref:Probable potassium transport system protein Kup n=2 Tax=Brevibacteriaceae TaxID=85019 RepID=A0A6N9H6Z2_9MICO|nr:potassium transporter Kup [Brevibacterium rongguiense]
MDASGANTAPAEPAAADQPPAPDPAQATPAAQAAQAPPTETSAAGAAQAPPARAGCSTAGLDAVGAPEDHPRHTSPLLVLIIGAMGVVFGDIGTSPLYSLQTVFSVHHNSVDPSEQDVLGVISMVLWCIMLIVSFTYVGLILRADNQGEGGILSLAALIGRKLGKRSSRASAALILAVIGASLFYGDSLITPAISVMSSIEGLEVANPAFAEYVVPAAIVVLTALFAVQRWGTGFIGRAFGPIMIAWFVVIAALGVPQIVANPSILRAVSPTYALAFAIDRPFVAFIAIGAVVLSVTGVEALYADMGHFGRRPIMLAWFCLICPALLLNYFGQGAMILRHPDAIDNPFFHLAPDWARIPLVVLATCATVIASQAVISGAFSVSRQATRLSLLPRLKVIQTSRREGGQIYMPAVNAGLFLGVLALILSFKSSEALASAYGLSVTGTLILELSLFLLLAQAVWKWNLAAVIAVGAVIGGVELSLFAANVVKVASGGWLPLLIASVIIVVMTTWLRGSRIMFGRRADMEGPIDDFVEEVHERGISRVPGVAVYPHGDPTTAPLALRRNVEFNHVLHEHVVILTIKHLGVPHVRRESRVVITDLGRPGDGIVHVYYRVGFNDSQDVPRALRQAVGRSAELDFDASDARYVLSVFRIEPGEDTCMPRWQKFLFRVLEKASTNRTQALHLPGSRTIVMGASAEL